MACINEHGSCRHGEAGSGEVMNKEVGDTGMNGGATDCKFNRDPSRQGYLYRLNCLEPFIVEALNQSISMYLFRQHLCSKELPLTTVVARPTTSHAKL